MIKRLASISKEMIRKYKGMLIERLTPIIKKVLIRILKVLRGLTQLLLLVIKLPLRLLTGVKKYVEVNR